MMGRTDIATKDILNATYFKESAHNLKKTIFFKLKLHITTRISGEKIQFEHSAIFRSRKLTNIFL